MTLNITAWKIQRRDKPQRGYSGLMDLPTLLSFSLFAFVATFTPGPNNVMLAASGANFGFRASLPHILGVFAGFMTLVVAAGFGLASLFAALPALYDILKITSILFLLYLAWKIANAAALRRAMMTGLCGFGRLPCFNWSTLKGLPSSFRRLRPIPAALPILRVKCWQSLWSWRWSQLGRPVLGRYLAF